MRRKKTGAVFAMPLLVAGTAAAQPVEPIRLEPRLTYVAARATTPPRIDGVIEDVAWSAATYTTDFGDIEGATKPMPGLRTRVKMLWDDTYLYIAAEMEEPHVWGTLTQRDAVIFHDNDFEVFIDPDADTHAYYELEINALNTVWDLLLTMPYRDGGRAIDSWDIQGLQHAVHIDGTINDAADRDRGWSVELALPWAVLSEAAPQGRAPRAGEQWRINFSRVQWETDVVAGKYVKRKVPEHNWVWSPQGAINMHMPERWGTLQFSGEASADPNEELRDMLRAQYYAQRRYHDQHKQYAGTLLIADPRARLRVTDSMYEITAPAANGRTLHINQDGRIWET